MSRIAAFLLIALSLASCASPPKKRPVVTPRPLSCNDQPAQITFYSPDEAKLTYAGKSYALERKPSADGAKYGNRTISFWNKGIDATLTFGDRIIPCTYVPQKGL